MQYKYKKANIEDRNKLIQYKLKSILTYASNLSDEEENRIRNYVEETTLKELSNYKIIQVNEKEIGCVLVTKKENKFLLDELYIEEEYRNLGIGTTILKDILRQYTSIYLWVYKTNEHAIAMYKKLGFRVIQEEKERYFMEKRKEI